jgi:hypothetical protein
VFNPILSMSYDTAFAALTCTEYNERP